MLRDGATTKGDLMEAGFTSAEVDAIESWESISTKLSRGLSSLVMNSNLRIAILIGVAVGVIGGVVFGIIGVIQAENAASAALIPEYPWGP
jgi:thiamine transporter ThiT